jgi:hypothetical protein
MYSQNPVPDVIKRIGVKSRSMEFADEPPYRDQRLYKLG